MLVHNNARQARMTKLKTSLSLALVLFCAGCAHSIVTTPDLVELKHGDAQLIDKNVAYYISKEDRNKQVSTPGGGGDKVSYYPYKELEPALYKSLSNVFRRAYPLESPTDLQTIQAKGITFVFTPTIATNSSSESALTWPPTKFTVTLTCKAVDVGGKGIWEKQFTGEGAAEFEEFKTDFSLAAKRASQSAFQQFQRALATDPEFRR
jgi:hypothetical protein